LPSDAQAARSDMYRSDERKEGYRSDRPPALLPPEKYQETPEETAEKSVGTHHSLPAFQKNCFYPDRFHPDIPFLPAQSELAQIQVPFPESPPGSSQKKNLPVFLSCYHLIRHIRDQCKQLYNFPCALSSHS